MLLNAAFAPNDAVLQGAQIMSRYGFECLTKSGVMM